MNQTYSENATINDATGPNANNMNLNLYANNDVFENNLYNQQMPNAQGKVNKESISFIFLNLSVGELQKVFTSAENH